MEESTKEKPNDTTDKLQADFTAKAKKNSWLYPTDEFGKMREGVVYNEREYSYDLNYSDDDSFIISSVITSETVTSRFEQ